MQDKRAKRHAVSPTRWKLPLVGGLGFGWILDRYSIRAAGRVFDLTGNYDATLALLAGGAGCALLLSLLVWRRPGLERLPAVILANAHRASS